MKMPPLQYGRPTPVNTALRLASADEAREIPQSESIRLKAQDEQVEFQTRTLSLRGQKGVPLQVPVFKFASFGGSAGG
jgi:hypothetical protein